MIESCLTLSQVGDWLASLDGIWEEITTDLWNNNSVEMQESQANIIQSWNSRYTDCGLNDGYYRMISVRDKGITKELT